MEKTSLRSFLSLVVSAALLLALFGCKASETSSPESSDSRLGNSNESALTTTGTATTTTSSTTEMETTTSTTPATTTTNTSTTTNIYEKPYRVVCAQEDGIVIDLYDSGFIFVKLDNANFEIGPLKTVVMVFSKSDLIPADGTFLSFTGEKLHYSYILENPKSIRLASEGEPTFG